MTKNTSIDEFLIQTKESVKWKHFLFFYLIQIVIISITYGIARNVSQQTTEMFYANISAILSPPIITALMIYSYKGQKKLNLLEKTIALIGLLLTSFICPLIINYFNLFNRSFNQQEFIDGVIRNGVFEIIMLIICFPIIYFVKQKNI